MRWQISTRLIAKVIRISQAKFHCNRLTTVYNIFNITPVSFFFGRQGKNLKVKTFKNKVKAEIKIRRTPDSLTG